MHGQFVWYELTTPDADASKKFYPRFTGWGTQAFDKDYTMWTTGGAPFAGIFTLNDDMRARGVPPNWMAYIESDDVDGTLQKATSLGGTVMHGPEDIPGTGRFGVVQDPQGAVFGVYKSVRPSASWNGTPVEGRMSWHELMTTDYKKAAGFYGALFGWGENGEMDMGNGEMYAMFGHGDSMYGGMFNRPAELASAPPYWLMYINVKDVAKAVKTATKAGATVLRPQMDIPGGTIAILADPQGAAFAVHDLKAPVAPAEASTATKAVGKAKKAVSKAKAAVGKSLKKAAKAVKRAVKKVKAKAAPAKAKAKVKAKAAKPRAKAKAAVKAKPKARAKAAARKVAAKTRSKAKVVVKRAGARGRAGARRKR